MLRQAERPGRHCLLFHEQRNYLKSFSERRRDATPAQRLGLTTRKLTVDDLLAQRRFPSRVHLPKRLARS